jgi:hypothetical protein
MLYVSAVRSMPLGRFNHNLGLKGVTDKALFMRHTVNFIDFGSAGLFAAGKHDSGSERNSGHESLALRILSHYAISLITVAIHDEPPFCRNGKKKQHVAT